MGGRDGLLCVGDDSMKCVGERFDSKQMTTPYKNWRHPTEKNEAVDLY